MPPQPDRQSLRFSWADGIQVNARLEDDANIRQCMLVVMEATAEEGEELIAVTDGHRESEQGWHGALVDLNYRGVDLNHRGMAIQLLLVIEDGHWASGLRYARCSHRRESCAVGCTRRPTC